jgi:hypothetical protein
MICFHLFIVVSTSKQTIHACLVIEMEQHQYSIGVLVLGGTGIGRY